MKLFLGLIFILLDFQTQVGTAVVGLLPDFIGYFLVMKALEERDDAWRHGAFALMLVSVVLYIADLVDKAAGAQILFTGMGFVAENAMLVLLYHIVRDEKRLRDLFPVLAFIRMLCALLSWLPLVGPVCVAASAVVSVCWLAGAYGPLVKRK